MKNQLKKKYIINDVLQILNKYSFILILHHNNLSNSEWNELKKVLNENNTKIKIVKNKLVKNALNNTKYKLLKNLFVGPTVMIYSNDPINKVVYNYLKNYGKLTILSAIFEQKIITLKLLKNLTDISSKEELQLKFIQTVNNPSYKVYGMLQQPIYTLLTMLKMKSLEV